MTWLKLLLSARTLWLIAAGVIACAGLWIHGYSAGKTAAKVTALEAQAEAALNEKRETDTVRQRVQSLDDAGIDRELCRINIVRRNAGCDKLSGMGRTGEHKP